MLQYFASSGMRLAQRKNSRLFPPTQKRSQPSRRIGVGPDTEIGANNVLFLERLLLHYAIYRRYPLKPWPALKNAWRMVLR
jgi:hypothetical protein